MEKKPLKTKQKTSSLGLCKETLRQLEKPELRHVGGGAKIWIPVGFADDTTPLYVYQDVP
jgi:hypothetical protein